MRDVEIFCRNRCPGKSDICEVYGSVCNDVIDYLNYIGMEQISKNFRMSEFSVSATAVAAGIPNEIPERVKPAVRALVTNLLQPLCDRCRWHDRINSGYRSPQVNALVGGSPRSQHLRGEASDNVFYYVDAAGRKMNIAPINVLRAVEREGLDFDQMIAYPTFVHLSYTTTRPNRRQVLYSKDYRGERL